MRDSAHLLCGFEQLADLLDEEDVIDIDLCHTREARWGGR
jgi:hypothetical protein